MRTVVLATLILAPQLYASDGETKKAKPSKSSDKQKLLAEEVAKFRIPTISTRYCPTDSGQRKLPAEDVINFQIPAISTRYGPTGSKTKNKNLEPKGAQYSRAASTPTNPRANYPEDKSKNPLKKFLFRRDSGPKL